MVGGGLGPVLAGEKVVECERVAGVVGEALEDESVTWEVFNARSAGDRGWQSIEKAREVLGYEPQDDAEAVEPPG